MSFDWYQVILLVTEAHRCEQLAQGCYAALSRWKLNPRPNDRKSNALPLCHWTDDKYKSTPALQVVEIAQHTWHRTIQSAGRTYTSLNGDLYALMSIDVLSLQNVTIITNVTVLFTFGLRDIATYGLDRRPGGCDQKSGTNFWYQFSGTGKSASTVWPTLRSRTATEQTGRSVL